ncbi:class I SAM-dependent methyltransferase [Herbaspirillum sp. LeCh32-8]|uniref:class I SAM-dependent methyltransferase n=1 Tax=Herbaspirillum sp. LeCh32-8 TaxID=2821356 RepID=UPI001AE251AB|nr:class I SAM-dependent methyltransferase [Herbaspirillum sp. LeCh32-8]MBP0597327.1 class I SAM-dependent methyltransferase [Herbaspirillum sp. LeCh32-8]
MEWSSGYVHGIDYPVGFFPEQSPVHLSFACLAQGIEPVALDGEFTYMELGCGQGLTSNVLAAANPQGRFYAVDFLPTQVRGAQEMASAAGIDNLTVLECSFEQMAHGEIDLPAFDFVTMYGVYSWVDGKNRDYIVEFLRRYLKPGGIVYLNYNALPGWSSALSLQRTLREFGRNDHCDRQAQLHQGSTLVRALSQAGAAVFGKSEAGGLQRRMRALETDDPGYLAHEYLNQGWDALFSIDVIQSMARAKLDYVGSAELAYGFPELYLSHAQQSLLAQQPNAGMRELVWDQICNSSFREDVYVRGARRMSAQRRDAWLERCGLALTEASSRITLELPLAIGNVHADPHTYQPVMDALRQRPHSLAELAALPALRKQGRGLREIASMAILLSASRQAAPFFLCAAGQSQQAAQRLNRLIAAWSSESDRFQVLASPLLGNGVPSGLLQRVAFDQLARASSQPEQWVGPMAQAIHRQGTHLQRGGAPLSTREEIHAELLSLAQAICVQRLPVWANLNMAPEAAPQPE